ncbi:MAG: DUF1018 domain-containing protein [Victivallaceae bacterium]|nr:DUF1018 domain-containing protein [Victivallaceae bacterium]
MCTIAAVKIAQKQHAVPDAEYRRLLDREFGAASCRELTDSQRSSLRRMLAGHNANRDDMSAMERKIWALWYELKPALPEPRRTFNYLLGVCSRAAGRAHRAARLSELDPREQYKAIEALKQMVDAADPVPF